MFLRSVSGTYYANTEAMDYFTVEADGGGGNYKFGAFYSGDTTVDLATGFASEALAKAGLDKVLAVIRGQSVGAQFVKTDSGARVYLQSSRAPFRYLRVTGSASDWAVEAAGRTVDTDTTQAGAIAKMDALAASLGGTLNVTALTN